MKFKETAVSLAVIGWTVAAVFAWRGRAKAVEVETKQPSFVEQPGFYVTSAGRAQLGYYPQGWGRKPKSKISISLWNEPDGPGSASIDWKYLFDVDVDSNGMFGFSSNSPFYLVHRAICGNPENGQTVVFMAKTLTTGTVRMHWPGADIYFTFQPCP